MNSFMPSFSAAQVGVAAFDARLGFAVLAGFVILGGVLLAAIAIGDRVKRRPFLARTLASRLTAFAAAHRAVASS